MKGVNERLAARFRVAFEERSNPVKITDLRHVNENVEYLGGHSQAFRKE